MAIQYLAGNRIQGLSGDTKPTNVAAGSSFYETDTFVEWRWNGSTWVEMTGCFNPNLTEPLTNKTLNASSNTITDTSTAAGDLFVSNGTKFLRKARGTANQVFHTNAGGTDVEWTDPPAGSGDMILANTQTVSGAKTFNDATLVLRNPANTYSSTIKSGAQTATRTFTFPTSGNASDTIATLSAAVTWTGTQNYMDNNLRINNPAVTASYNFGSSAISADRLVILPPLAGTDTFVFEEHTQSLTNKDLTDATNTIYKFVPFTFIGSAITTFSARYYMMWNSAGGNNGLTESAVQLTFPYNILLTRLYVKMSANTHNGNTIVGFRDDGSTVTSVTVSAGSVATVDSGPISVTVAANSLIDWIVDTTASNTGSLTVGMCTAIGFVY